MAEVKTINYHYIEALIKIESSSPDFATRYEWLLLQVDNEEADISLQKAKEYLNTSYNRMYQGDVPLSSRWSEL